MIYHRRRAHVEEIPFAHPVYFPEKAVRTHLAQGAKTLGEIKAVLKAIGSDMTPDGVIKLLHRLEKDGIIKKKTFLSKAYPIYYLTKKGLGDIAIKANMFQHYALTSFLNNLPDFPEDEKGRLDYLKKIVDTIGLYAFYCISLW